MDSRHLGRTGLRVSAIGFGGAPIGIDNYLNEQDRDSEPFRRAAELAVQAAVKRGINYFDTSPSYGAGRSEALFGRVLEPYRDSVFIATKFKAPDDVSPEQLTRSLNESLDRLKTTYVDVLQFHGLNFDDFKAEALLHSCVPEWLKRMKLEGKFRFAGLTAETPSGALERLIATQQFDVLQIGYNIVAQGACDYRWGAFGVIPMAKKLDMGIVTMRTSTSGAFQRLLASEFPDIDLSRVTRLAIRFVLSTPEVDCALVGMQSVQEVEENVKLIENQALRLDLERINLRR